MRQIIVLLTAMALITSCSKENIQDQGTQQAKKSEGYIGITSTTVICADDECSGTIESCPCTYPPISSHTYLNIEFDWSTINNYSANQLWVTIKDSDGNFYCVCEGRRVHPKSNHVNYDITGFTEPGECYKFTVEAFSSELCGDEFEYDPQEDDMGEFCLDDC